ncbi:Toprim domain-containing protein [Methylobacterium phyllostachyos]|uniref:Toprim domain-containing protein n=1 Tax=Methylobacterium phyllostachyos TaxID=582672 RepID=A0A1H0K879_9HYPH|nr:Toprim domain-containing protein [Methylobacterium phyllostachyos]
MTPSLAQIASALRGQVAGRQVLAPGPGHSHRDRSLSVRLSDASPDGFIVHSHAGDDFRLCRDHVAAALGLPLDRWRETREQDPAEAERRAALRRRAEAQERADAAWRLRRAVAMWQEAQHPSGTVVEAYLRSRCLDLPDEIAGAVLRFHPACPWGEGTAPAMVSAIRSLNTGELVGVHRTALDADARKLGRKVFGSATAAAIMLDDQAEVSTGLTVGEGIETCLAARQIGLKPVWSLISAGNIGALPVLPGIEALTVLGEVDTAPNRPSATAFERVALRWDAAGHAVDIVMPRAGKDMNDALMAEVGACA